jgi:hypothetical protein
LSQPAAIDTCHVGWRAIQISAVRGSTGPASTGTDAASTCGASLAFTRASDGRGALSRQTHQACCTGLLLLDKRCLARQPPPARLLACTRARRRTATGAVQDGVRAAVQAELQPGAVLLAKCLVQLRLAAFVDRADEVNEVALRELFGTVLVVELHDGVAKWWLRGTACTSSGGNVAGTASGPVVQLLLLLA